MWPKAVNPVTTMTFSQFYFANFNVCQIMLKAMMINNITGLSQLYNVYVNIVHVFVITL
jgi:hypothetical protein